MVILISAMTWLTVDAHAREAVFIWIKQVYETKIVHRFTVNENQEVLSTYSINWVPEGFVIDEEYTNNVLHRELYYSESSDQFILFEYNTSSHITEYTDYDFYEEVNFGDFTGFYYSESEDSPTNSLLLTDSRGISIYIDTELDRGSLFKIASSIKKQ